MKSKTTNYYCVVVRDPNSWSASTGIHLELANCGHRHKSVEAAATCKAKLTAWYCICGERSDSHRRCSSSTGHRADHTSARWYHAQIEDSNGKRINPEDEGEGG